jgi:hypothetical protein
VQTSTFIACLSALQAVKHYLTSLKKNSAASRRVKTRQPLPPLIFLAEPYQASRRLNFLKRKLHYINDNDKNVKSETPKSICPPLL